MSRAHLLDRTSTATSCLQLPCPQQRRGSEIPVHPGGRQLCKRRHERMTHGSSVHDASCQAILHRGPHRGLPWRQVGRSPSPGGSPSPSPIFLWPTTSPSLNLGLNSIHGGCARPSGLWHSTATVFSSHVTGIASSAGNLTRAVAWALGHGHQRRLRILLGLGLGAIDAHVACGGGSRAGREQLRDQRRAACAPSKVASQACGAGGELLAAEETASHGGP